MVPDRCKTQDLPAGLETWEELVFRSERSRASGNDDEDIKTAALEALVPSEQEQPLAMNRTRLITYEQVRGEIHAYFEACRSQFASWAMWQEGILIPVPTKTLFVGTVGRKVTPVQNFGRTPRTSLVLEEGASFLEKGDQTAAAEQQPQRTLASSLDLASFEKPGGSAHFDAEGRKVEMDIRHGCGDFGIPTGCEDGHRNEGERV